MKEILVLSIKRRAIEKRVVFIRQSGRQTQDPRNILRRYRGPLEGDEDQDSENLL